MKYNSLNYKFVFALVEGDDKDERIANAVQWMMYWLRFKSLCNQTGCVVFDIDDTLVDNKEKPIPSMIKLYKLCISLGFIVNIVTARPESPKNRKETARMLDDRGITDYEALYMMPANLNTTASIISTYKSNARADIAQRHEILANCGDMWTDHIKYPTSLKEFQDRNVEETAVFFIPGQSFPCLKLPGEID
tara:strand:- start:950 stop:1525 length:576 start_codon:yes stop_codon:yes gene_type:complete